MKVLSLLFLLTSISLFANDEEARLAKRVQSHFILKDYAGAQRAAEYYLYRHPHSKELKINYIEALALNGFEKKALEFRESLIKKFPEEKENRALLNTICWGILQKGVSSMQYATRLTSLIGAYLTRDVKAVPMIRDTMKDRNAILRTVAVQLACQYRDAPLQEEVSRLFSEEKIWLVRLEILKAVGKMGLKNESLKLKEVLSHDRTSMEEKAACIEALLSLNDQIDETEFQSLVESDRAGLRRLACEIAVHIKMDFASDYLMKLLDDPRSDVRIRAMNAIGLHYRKSLDPNALKEKLLLRSQDVDPSVAITANWALALVEPELGIRQMESWLYSEQPECRRLAAAALATTGKKALPLIAATVKEHADPFVKGNLAMGLIGQRYQVDLACNTIYELLRNQPQLWVMDQSQNPLFQVLSPCSVSHIDQIPNYPQAIDQMTRLHLLGLLAVMEDPRAEPGIREFLEQRRWGVTGFAAATLLKEGDEEALELIRSLLKDAEKNVRIQAALVLAYLGKDPSVVGLLQEAYHDCDHSVKLYILEALGQVGNQSSFDFLVQALNEPFQVLRVVAASSLVLCLNR